MENLWAEAILFLTITGFGVLYFTIKNLLPSYFTEKGKNIATKQDISEITRLVEETKQSFVEQTEKLKAKLTTLSTLQIGLVAEERNAIIDYNEKYFKWLNMLTDSHLGNCNEESNDELAKYRGLLRDAYMDYINSETRLDLFVEDESIKVLAVKLKLITLEKLVQLPVKCIINLTKENNIKASYGRKLTADENKHFFEQNRKIFNEFMDPMLEGYKEVAPISHEFQEVCRAYLYKLLKSE